MIPAIVWCEGAFLRPEGKTAHGLVRRSRRYDVRAVIDSRCSDEDAGEVLDGVSRDIPIVADLESALAFGPTHLIIGLAPDGGRLPQEGREVIESALASGLHVVSGLHDFISEDPGLARLAAANDVTLTDVRKPPDRRDLHAFSGCIEEVWALKVALLGTDSAVGKRTTAWMLVDALNAAGRASELVGTGQTAWLQGSHYGIVLDSLVNDFVAGELEHAVSTCWEERRPDVIVIEGQGSLMNPAYPGGLEILAATRPNVVVLQHAPARTDYDGFPGYPIHHIERQIEAIEILSGVPVIAVTLNEEGLDPCEVTRSIASLKLRLGVPVIAPLTTGLAQLAELLEDHLGGPDE